MTAAEYWSKAVAISNWILSLGPDLPEALAYLKQMRDSAVNLIGVLTRRFPKSAEAIPDSASAPEDVQALVLQIEEKQRSAAGRGNKAGAIDGTIIMQIIQFLIANPAFLNWLMSIFTPKT
jgi:hypothetical protein